MSTTDSDKLVSIIQPSETLMPLLQNAATETRPAAIALKTCGAMTPFQPSGSSLVMILRVQKVEGVSLDHSNAHWPIITT
jgi:hypothetical protein